MHHKTQIIFQLVYGENVPERKRTGRKRTIFRENVPCIVLYRENLPCINKCTVLSLNMFCYKL